MIKEKKDVIDDDVEAALYEGMEMDARNIVKRLKVKMLSHHMFGGDLSQDRIP